MTHTSSGHLGYDKCLDMVTRTWFVRHLGRHLRIFLKYCPECLVYQTRRHRPYGVLEPIQSPSVPFHTLTFDFILALPVTDDGMDCILSITDKFSKRVTFVVGKSTWSAAEWAVVILDRLAIADWGLPAVVISNRDRKFMSELWTTIFEKLGVKLLYSTAYHPQTDGASERTNQTAEIAFRFFINTLENIKIWPIVLPRLQSVLNNSMSTSTGVNPNEVVYGFSLNKPLSLATLPHQLPQHATTRIAAADAISFAQMSQKRYYDRRHQPLFLRPGIDKVYLRLHKGYSVPASMLIKKVLDQQYIGPFDVIKKVGSQAYQLAIPDHWRIHPVFTVAMLEPAPFPDPFDRPRPDHPGSVFVEGDTDENQSYRVERLMNRRVIRRGRGYSVEYLVRWVGYGPEYDTWYNIKDLDESSELVKEYDELVGLRQPTSPPQAASQ